MGNEGFLRDPLLNMLHSLVVTVPGRVVDQQKSVKLIKSPENPQSLLITPPKNPHGT